MELTDALLTLRQKSILIKSLRYMERHKKINQYCDEYKKSWTELSYDEASNLIKILDKMSWQ